MKIKRFLFSFLFLFKEVIMHMDDNYVQNVNYTDKNLRKSTIQRMAA